MPGRKKNGPAYAGAASLLLHILLAAGFLYCLPAAVSSGSGGVFTLSLLDFPGTEQSGGPRAGAESALPHQAEPAAENRQVRQNLSAELPELDAPAALQKQDTKKKSRAVASKSAPRKKSRDSRLPEKDKGTDKPSSISTSHVAVSNTGHTGTSTSGTAGTAVSASAGNGADVPFGRPCGPAFTRFSRPVYPLQARRAGISGLVKLRVFLDAAGDVRNIEVLESGHNLLAEAACASIRRSAFRPYTQDGKSLPSRTVIPIRFSLEQER